MWHAAAYATRLHVPELHDPWMDVAQIATVDDNTRAEVRAKFRLADHPLPTLTLPPSSPRQTDDLGESIVLLLRHLTSPSPLIVPIMTSRRSVTRRGLNKTRHHVSKPRAAIYWEQL